VAQGVVDQVPAEDADRVGAFGPRHLHQAFGEARQPLEGGLDLGDPVSGGRIGGFDLEALRLGDGTRERRPEFVGRVGGEAALGVAGGLEPGEKVVECPSHRRDLRGEVIA
jgi:hypothetical protein